MWGFFLDGENVLKLTAVTDAEFHEYSLEKKNCTI